MKRTLIVLCAIAGLACSRSRNGDAATSLTSDAPVLNRLRPDTIAIGQGAISTLVLEGRGFAPASRNAAGQVVGGNSVQVGRAHIPDVMADSTGTTIRVAIPLSYTDTTSSGRPMAFMPGRYPVTVSTVAGRSNAVTLTMVR